MKSLKVLPALLFCAFPLFAEQYQRFEENGKIGLKDQQGAIILPASFDALGWSDGNFSVIGQITGFRHQSRWGLVNLKKEFITKPEFESLTYQGGDRVIVSKSVSPFSIKFGCIDLQGKLVVPFSYDEIKLHGLRVVAMVKNGLRYEYGLIDLTNKSILPIRYKRIAPIGSLRYAVQDFTNKYALCSEDGKWITEFSIDSISKFSFDLAITHQEWRRGLIDRNGETKAQAVYREIKITSPGHVSVRKADKWKILGADYQELQSVEADELIFDESSLAHLIIDGKTGLIDENLQARWAADYDYIGPIENNMAIVRKNGKWGLLRIDQTVVLSLDFDSICVSKNFIRIKTQLAGISSWELYDTFGIRKTITKYEFIDAYNGKFFPAKNRGYWGALDRYGKEIMACVYDSILSVKNGLVAVRFRGDYGIVTMEDQWRLTPQQYPVEPLNDERYIERKNSLMSLKDFDGNVIYFTDNPVQILADRLVEHLPNGIEKEINFLGQLMTPLTLSPHSTTAPPNEQIFKESEGLLGIKRDGKFGFVDRRGRLRIANRYEGIGEFHAGLAPIKLLGRWGFINAADQIMIQPTFDTIENFYHGVAKVSRNGKSGLIGQEGKELLELEYDSIIRLPNQLFLLTLNGLKGLADANGRILIEPRFEYLTEAANGHLIVRQNNLYGILTHDGMSILPLQYNKLIYIQQKNIFLAQLKTEWESLEIN